MLVYLNSSMIWGVVERIKRREGGDGTCDNLHCIWADSQLKSRRNVEGKQSYGTLNTGRKRRVQRE
jgi:hypothetical protein